jgi:predicted N-acetyltransferase YhbS
MQTITRASASDPQGELGINCEWEVPAEVFMVLVLDDSKTEGLTGLARYRQEFSTVS